MAYDCLRCCWAWGQDVLFVHCLNWAEAIAWATWTQEPALEGGGGAAAAPPHETLRSYLELCRSREPYKKATAIKQAESNM